MLFKQNTRADQPATKSTDGLPSIKHSDSLPSAKLPLPSAMAERAAAAASAAAPAVGPAADEGETGKRLIVGKGIQLKGEITACDRLVVEGQVEVTMNATRTLEIKPSGHFIGSCEVEEADVSGVYEGDLTVRGRLIVHHNGRVTGKICYGELELERGSQISGELTVRERQQSQAATPAQATAGRRNAA
jgi:cytoskeletal protein CcmA (bactofilin family)